MNVLLKIFQIFLGDAIVGLPLDNSAEILTKFFGNRDFSRIIAEGRLVTVAVSSIILRIAEEGEIERQQHYNRDDGDDARLPTSNIAS